MPYRNPQSNRKHFFDKNVLTYKSTQNVKTTFFSFFKDCLPEQNSNWEVRGQSKLVRWEKFRDCFGISSHHWTIVKSEFFGVFFWNIIYWIIWTTCSRLSARIELNCYSITQHQTYLLCYWIDLFSNMFHCPNYDKNLRWIRNLQGRLTKQK